jgi:hypothetical protein
MNPMEDTPPPPGPVDCIMRRSIFGPVAVYPAALPPPPEAW